MDCGTCARPRHRCVPIHRPGCYCDEGYLKNAAGICVPKHKCNEPDEQQKPPEIVLNDEKVPKPDPFHKVSFKPTEVKPAKAKPTKGKPTKGKPQIPNLAELKKSKLNLKTLNF